METEIWKDVKNYKGYYKVSNLGNVKSISHLRIDKLGRKTITKDLILAKSIDRRGYFIVGLYKKACLKLFKVHRLVCIAFHPNPKNKPQVNHKDGIKSHCEEWNLEWNTYKENADHAYATGLKNGLAVKGEKNFSAKLTQLQVDLIRKEYVPRKVPLRIFAEKYGVSESSICHIIRGNNWV